MTILTALLGYPVAHSYSPAMHNAAAAALGLDLIYLPLPVVPDDLPAAVRGLCALGFRGANVTVPHKQAVAALVDELSDAARLLGAVNTIVIERDDQNPATICGHNTDWSGFLADLQALDIPVDGRDCLVLGAGGSARAVVYALQQAGGCVRLFSRRPEQADQVVAALDPARPESTLPAQPYGWAHLPEVAAVSDFPLIVNTTPLGMSPAIDRSPWPESVPFPAGAIVYDLVYNPATTRLMRQAEAAGCRTANGLGMLVGQAAEAFALWTGQTPDPAFMRAAVAERD